jgi:hypothetical protein
MKQGIKKFKPSLQCQVKKFKPSLQCQVKKFKPSLQYILWSL